MGISVAVDIVVTELNVAREGMKGFLVAPLVFPTLHIPLEKQSQKYLFTVRNSYHYSMHRFLPSRRI